VSARRAALAAALLLGAALALVIAVRTPWSLLPAPPGGHTAPDPTGGLPAAYLGRAASFAGALRPASAVGIVLGLVVSGLFGLTRLGARLVGVLGRPVRGRWARLRWVEQVVAAVAVLVVLGRVVLLPLSVWSEVVLLRYGVSTASWGLWVRDLAVSTAFGVGTTALVVLLLVGVARRAPRTWWAWGAGVAAALVVAGSFLWPVVLEPAFNRFTPMAAGPLRSDLLALAERNGTPVDDVLVADASRRTTSLNAYVSGLGSTRRIVVYDTVLRSLPDDQIESIVAHELGHVSADDVLTGTLMGALGAVAGVAALGWILTWRPLLRRAGADGPGDPRVVPALLFVVAAATLVATPVQDLVSRQLEARADLHALDLARDPAAFTAMQQRLAQASLAQPEPPRVWHLLFGDHPTEAERVAMAQDWVRLGRGSGAR
jgi:STE24 endopeptidase